MGSRVDEGPSSTSYEDVLSRVNAARVITWLRPVEESWSYTFGRNFPFLLMFEFLFLSRDLIL